MGERARLSRALGRASTAVLRVMGAVDSSLAGRAPRGRPAAAAARAEFVASLHARHRRARASATIAALPVTAAAESSTAAHARAACAVGAPRASARRFLSKGFRRRRRMSRCAGGPVHRLYVYIPPESSGALASSAPDRPAPRSSVVPLRVSKISMRAANVARNVATATTTLRTPLIVLSPCLVNARSAFRLVRLHKAHRPSAPTARG